MVEREERTSRPPRKPGEPRDPRDLRQPGDVRDPRDLRQPGDPRDRGNGSNGGGIWAERRMHRILGIAFTVLGLFVSVDLLHLTLQFQTQHEALTAQITCNERQNAALVAIGKARRDVDSAALFYDETLQVFLATPVIDREPSDPATQNMSRALNSLVDARKRAVDAYERNPFTDCDH